MQICNSLKSEECPSNVTVISILKAKTLESASEVTPYECFNSGGVLKLW